MDFEPYHFIIERDDGTTFEQIAPDITWLIDSLGDGYLVVDIY